MSSVIKEVLNMGRTILMVPQGSKVLTMQAQRSHLVLWLEADISEVKIDRHFIVIGTGNIVPPKSNYVGTAQIGEYVWHVYETNLIQH